MIPLAIVLAAASAQSEPTPPLLGAVTALREIVARHGQIVRVRGWVDRDCYPLGCSLTAQPRSADKVQPSALQIAYRPEFEPSLLARRGREIVIEGTLNAECRGKVRCTDRAPDLVPLRIVEVIGQTPASP